MNITRPLACAGAALALLAAAAHARGGTGWRLDASGGGGILGEDHAGDLVGCVGFDAARVHAASRAVQTEYALAYRHTASAGLTAEVSGSAPAASDLGALLACAALHGPVRGHTSPFLRLGIGPGYWREGDVSSFDLGDAPPHRRVWRGPKAFGLAGEAGLGFGRLPAEGFGLQGGLHLLVFVCPDGGLAESGLSLGVVY